MKYSIENILSLLVSLSPFRLFSSMPFRSFFLSSGPSNSFPPFLFVLCYWMVLVKRVSVLFLTLSLCHIQIWCEENDNWLRNFYALNFLQYATKFVCVAAAVTTIVAWEWQNLNFIHIFKMNWTEWKKKLVNTLDALTVNPAWNFLFYYFVDFE